MHHGVRVRGIVLALTALACATARAGKENNVAKAIERGVAYLKSHQNRDGTWPYTGGFGEGSHPVSVAALAGLALLECGVPSTDQSLMKAAQVVRDGLTNTDSTYDLSLAVMFLDRLSTSADERLLQAGSVSLAAGQSPEGGWTYTCPVPAGDMELRRLRTNVERRNAGAGNPPSADSQVDEPQGTLDRRELGRMIRGLLGDDNSNTQFATLALWIARRHHLNLDRTLAAVEARFRRTQNRDGGWGYAQFGPGGMSSTASMTCAGLLGLAVGLGVSREAVLRTTLTPAEKSPSTRNKALPDPNRDEAVHRGLSYLAQVLEPALQISGGGNSGRANPGRGFGPGRGLGRGNWDMRGMGGSVIGNGLGSEYYFLWSLERVAMLYSLDAIGGKDWFDLGSRYVLQHQRSDGAWRGNLGESVDTCFALFFLRRANLATDLTVTLRTVPGSSQSASLQARPGPSDVSQDAASSVPPKVAEMPRRTKPATSREPTSRSSGSAENQTAQVAKKPTVGPQAPLPGLPPGVAEWKGGGDSEAARLSDQLVRASPMEQERLLEKLRDSKGPAYTDALAASIPLLTGAARTKARDALAERLARMSVATLRDKLQDKSGEVRRAAALACAMKKEKSLIPDLIDQLKDSESRVTRAAHVALKQLTDQDFGPGPSASYQDRIQAAALWRTWWTRNQ